MLSFPLSCVIPQLVITHALSSFLLGGLVSSFGVVAHCLTSLWSSLNCSAKFVRVGAPPLPCVPPLPCCLLCGSMRRSRRVWLVLCSRAGEEFTACKTCRGPPRSPLSSVLLCQLVREDWQASLSIRAVCAYSALCMCCYDFCVCLFCARAS